MKRSKDFDINRITRSILLIITISLFIIFFILFNSSYQQFEKIELRTKSLLELFRESQENVDGVYKNYSNIQQAYVTFSKSLSYTDYNQYIEQLGTFKSHIDSIIQTRDNYLKNKQITYIPPLQQKQTLDSYIEIKNLLDSAINFSSTLKYFPLNNETHLSVDNDERQLLNHNFNLLYSVNMSIIDLNDDRLLIKRDILAEDINSLFEESSRFRFETFLSLVFIFILICIIIYYQFYLSQYKRKLDSEKLYVTKLTEKKSNIFTNITHEIRTPINSLIGILEILKKKTNLYNEEDRLLVESAYTSITSTSKTINDILNLNTQNLAENNIHSFDIEDLIIDIIELHKSQAKIKNIALDYVMNKESPSIVYTDENKLRQIINNLISNGIKYADKGTVLCMIDVLSTGILRIKVKDEGKGFPKEIEDNIFKKYFTAEVDNKYSNGLGLGLYLTKKLVDSLNGQITISSIENKGTIFTIEIPIPMAKYKPQELPNYKSIKDLPANLSWLIVDDNTLNLLYLKQFFATFPNLYSATNGIEAYKIIEEVKIDIVITDINMPIMTGDELLLKIRENDSYNSIKVIATSSDNEQIKRLEVSHNCYFDGILIKPFNEKDLLKTITNTLSIK